MAIVANTDLHIELNDEMQFWCQELGGQRYRLLYKSSDMAIELVVRAGIRLPLTINWLEAKHYPIEEAFLDFRHSQFNVKIVTKGYRGGKNV